MAGTGYTAFSSMNARSRILLLAGTITILLLVGTFWFYIDRKPNLSLTHQDHQDKMTGAAPTVQFPTTSSASPIGTQPSRQEQENAMSQFLNTMKESLKKAGIKETPPMAERLRHAVLSRDHGEIIRAFHEAIYGRLQKMNEVLPIVKTYLADPGPFVRLTAARTLYTAGDRSGFETLLTLVMANEPILENEQDLRVEAARIFRQFHEVKAWPAIQALYQQTNNSTLLNAVVRLARENTPPELIDDLFKQKEAVFGVFNLVLAQSPEAGTLAKEMFLNPRVPSNYKEEAKNAAAWALIQIEKGEPYYSHLEQQAEKAVAKIQPQGPEVDTNQYKKAFRYFASVRHPDVAAFLENALDSSSNEIVQIAVVNLLFNQRAGSEKAKQVVLRELRGEQNKLGVELMMNIASQLDDREIRAAGKAFEQRSSDNSWQIYSVERRQWPIYNWIDDYVVTLNEESK